MINQGYESSKVEQTIVILSISTDVDRFLIRCTLKNRFFQLLSFLDLCICSQRVPHQSLSLLILPYSHILFY